jgi:hypothetical protein
MYTVAYSVGQPHLPPPMERLTIQGGYASPLVAASEAAYLTIQGGYARIWRSQDLRSPISEVISVRVRWR